MAINSFSFVVIIFASVLVCRLFDSRIARESSILILSLLFLSSYVTQWSQAIILVLILGAVYLIGVIKANSRNPWSSLRSLSIVAAIWVFLFLIKDPELLGFINPFNSHPVIIVGISYIIFRGITFILEVSFGDKISLLTFINYMLFFPTLLAGPIERFHRFDKMTAMRENLSANGYHNLNRILNGFIKKFLIADNLWDLGIFSMMASGQDFGAPVLWMGAMIMLALLYLDFSGYCDIVIGVAGLMGFKITENFNRPFAARNLQEFWGRWHMSLGSVIQDYVFSPLSKVAVMRVPRSAQMYVIAFIYVIAMVLVAMWHGTTMGFLIFGILQAAVLFSIQIWREIAKASAKRKGQKYLNGGTGVVRIWTGRALTYSFVSLTMIWWQASVPEALSTYKILLGLN